MIGISEREREREREREPVYRFLLFCYLYNLFTLFCRKVRFDWRWKEIIGLGSILLINWWEGWRARGGQTQIDHTMAAAHKVGTQRSIWMQLYWVSPFVGAPLYCSCPPPNSSHNCWLCCCWRWSLIILSFNILSILYRSCILSF